MEKFKKLKLIVTLVALFGLLFVLFKKESLKNILQYIGVALIGFALAWFFKPNEPSIPMTLIEEVVVTKDTCLGFIKTCELTLTDSLHIFQEMKIKKGKKHIRTTKPKVKLKSKDKRDSTYNTHYHQSYNEGLLRANIDLIIKSKDSTTTITDFHFTYEVDTITQIETKEKIVEKTIVLEPESRFVEKNNFVPVSVEQKYLRAVGGLYFNGDIKYQAGAAIQLQPLEIAILKNIGSKGMSANISLPLVKLKPKKKK